MAKIRRFKDLEGLVSFIFTNSMESWSLYLFSHVYSPPSVEAIKPFKWVGSALTMNPEGQLILKESWKSKISILDTFIKKTFLKDSELYLDFINDLYDGVSTLMFPRYGEYAYKECFSGTSDFLEKLSSFSKSMDEISKIGEELNNHIEYVQIRESLKKEEDPFKYIIEKLEDHEIEKFARVVVGVRALKDKATSLRSRGDEYFIVGIGRIWRTVNKYKKNRLIIRRKGSFPFKDKYLASMLSGKEQIKNDQFVVYQIASLFLGGQKIVYNNIKYHLPLVRRRMKSGDTFKTIYPVPDPSDFALLKVKRQFKSETRDIFEKTKRNVADELLFIVVNNHPSTHIKALLEIDPSLNVSSYR